MSRAGTVHALVPAGIDDPAEPSGGNVYDLRVLAGLHGLGRRVQRHHTWATVPDDAVVLVDGLVASWDQAAVTSSPSRVVLLLHEPLPGLASRAARAVVATSAATAASVPGRATVAHPGTDAAPLAAGSPSGRHLLCVGAVVPGKGQDVLLDALARLRDLDWQLQVVGSLTRDPSYAAGLARPPGVTFTGALTGAALDAAYAGADLLVLPSRAEAYGMVVTEALARGVPVVASDVGGVTEALRGGGVLVPPDDPRALAHALRRWLEDADHRRALRHAALTRRTTLTGWEATTRTIAAVLDEAAR